VRRKFDANGKLVETHGEYPSVVKAVAATMKVPLIDLNQSSKELLSKEGVEDSKRMFLWIEPNQYKTLPQGKKDDTHFSSYGASQMAALVCKAITDQKLGIAAFVKSSGFASGFSYELPIVYQPHFKKDTFNIIKYAAKSDGIFLNNVAINKAIDDCTGSGGGTVLIPTGIWLTGPLVLKSNVNLHLQKGALLLFTSDFDQFPLVKSSFEGVDAARCQSPISAENSENISISGEGIIHGSGDAWRPVKKDKLTASEWQRLIKTGVVADDKVSWFPSAKALKGSQSKDIGKLTAGKQLKDFEDIKDFLRPNMVRISNCKNVLLDGVTFENSPAWTLHILLSQQITLNNVIVKNPWYGQNTDALDLESCKNISMDGCVFDTGDDGICIKSGRDEEGRKRGVPTENLIANNCTVYHAHGGFVIGSEMSGGARNLFVQNCNFIGTDVGLRFKTTRGRGGVVEKIYANNINMKGIAAEAVLFDMYYMAKDPVLLADEKREAPKIEIFPVNEGTPQFRDFYMSNITCVGAAQGVFIRGLPEMSIKNIQLENLILQSKKGILCAEAEQVSFKNVKVITDDSNPVVLINNAKNISFDKLQYKPSTVLLFGITGKETRNINVKGTDISNAKKDIEYSEGADKKEVKFSAP